MKINKFKALQVVICCLFSALWSETQCVDNHTDILESATANRTSNMQLSSQSGVEDLEFEIKPSQILNEDLSPSWSSYISSPVKSVKCMVATGVLALGISWGVYRIYSYYYPITMNMEYLCEYDDCWPWFEDACKWLCGRTVFDGCGLHGRIKGWGFPEWSYACRWTIRCVEPEPNFPFT